jgi:hypothetical protein
VEGLAIFERVPSCPIGSWLLEGAEEQVTDVRPVRSFVQAVLVDKGAESRRGRTDVQLGERWTRRRRRRDTNDGWAGGCAG